MSCNPIVTTVGHGAGRDSNPPAWRMALRNSPLGAGYRSLRSRLRASRLLMGYGPGALVKEVWAPVGGERAIHRWYVEDFLNEHAQDFKGHGLEFEEDVYTSRIGGSRVEKLDVIHLSPIPTATIIADLTQPGAVPADHFDFIICTYVLSCTWDVMSLLHGIRNVLKPGGVLLGCVPGVHPYSPGQNDYWRFTPLSVSEMLAREFGEDRFTIRPYGNSLSACADVRGLAAEKFSTTELGHSNARYPVVLAFRCVKPD